MKNNLILAFIFQFLLTTRCSFTIDSLCKTNFTAINSDAMSLEILAEWCAEDPRCAYFFKIKEGVANTTIFNFLAYPIYIQEGGDLLYPIKTLLCSESEPLKILKTLWPLMLVAGQMDNKPQCGAGQSLVLNENSVVLECIYDMDTYPSTPDNEYAFFVAIVAIICVFVLLCCIVNFIRAATILRLIKNMSI